MSIPAPGEGASYGPKAINAPLSVFELATLDYVFGCSLWLVIVIVVVGGWGLIDWLRGRGKEASAD